MNKNFLSNEDLVELTGYKYPSKQAEILRAHRMFFITRRDGTLRLTWHHVENAGLNNKPYNDNDEPDWSAML